MDKNKCPKMKIRKNFPQKKSIKILHVKEIFGVINCENRENPLHNVV